MDNSIILFDGFCNFCNSSVNFIIKRDKKNTFKFASLQSNSGITLQKKFSLNPADMSSLILIKGEKYFTKTTAALKIARELKFPWNLLYIFIIVPPIIRNISYNIIANYRYKWFGKRDVCRIPEPELKDKFLE
jgi:predicted DCC family thiol-disulfide oxidoreductase YuxK